MTMAILPDETLIAALKALAEPTRLRIFNALMAGDSCNCELTEQLELSPSLLSHHLRVLRKAGLVTARQDAVDGRWIYYAVDRDMAATLHRRLDHLLDPARIQRRATLCGPEGQEEVEVETTPAMIGA
jgi:ArsR family transcriptional regulator